MSGGPALRVGGIPIGMDLSWVAISVFVVAAVGLRVSWDGASAAVAVSAGILGAALMVITVAGHELAHAVVARHRGLAVAGVTLFVFGGYTEMVEEPPDHGGELAVAVAGPVASVVLAGLLWSMRLLIGRGAFGDVLGLMAVVGLGVAAFNLLPGLPLDGGRVLRALVWRRTGESERGTLVAVRSGRTVGMLIVVAGIALLAVGRAPTGVWGIAIGWYLAHSAGVTGRSSGRGGSPVAMVMTDPGPVMCRSDVIETSNEAPLPVVDDGRVLGVVPAGSPVGCTAGDAMEIIQRGDVVDVDAPLGEVLRRTRRSGRPVVVVTGRKMVGVASIDAIEAFLKGWQSP